MVITVDEAAASQSTALHVTSDPAGAAVFVNGKKLGFTPGDFAWAPEGANHDRPLIVQLRRTGYAPHTTKYAANTPRIDLDVTMQPRKAVAPVAAPASEGDTNSEAAEATSADDSESSASEETESETESADPPAPSPEP